MADGAPAFRQGLKVALRISGDDFDDEVDALAAAAIDDMRRVGIKDECLVEGNPLTRMAVTCYAKSLFGFDNDDAARFQSSYRQIVVDLLNSSANSAGDAS